MASGIFPYRKTIATFDDYHPACVQPRVMMQRDGSMMAKTVLATTDNVVYDEGIGWRLRSYMDSYKEVQELTDADVGILRTSDGSLVGASSMVQFDSFAQQPITGITYAAGVQVVGSPMHEKRITAGDSFDNKLGADETAFPPPMTDDDTVPVDRVLVSRDNHEPWDGLLFVFDFPAANANSTAPAKGYFCGPAGSDQDSASDSSKLGLGQYCLKAYQDGGAVLAERLVDGSWKVRDAWQYSLSTDRVSNGSCFFHIRSDCYQDATGSFQGTTLTIKSTSSAAVSGSRPTYVEIMLALAITAVQNGHPTTHVYNAPRRTQQPTTVQKIRIDLHRLMRSKVQIAKHIYYTPGSLVDDYLSFDFPLTVGEDLYLYIPRSKPTGTELEVYVYDENGSALTQVGISTEYNRLSIYRFTPHAKQRYAKVRIDFLSDADVRYTPIVFSYAFYRNPAFSNDNPLTPLEVPIWRPAPALPQAVISSLSIEPQEGSQEGESCQIEIEDMTDSLLAILDERTMVPIRIETRLDAVDATQKGWLFTGYAINPEHSTTRHDPTSPALYPSPGGRKTYSLNCVGEWANSSESFSPRRMIWGTDLTGQFSKITDIVRLLWNDIYPTSMIDVPDLPITLFGLDPQAYMTEPGTRIMDHTASLVEEYIGAYTTFDGAAGTRGMQRVLMPKSPPYNNLAVFQEDGPGVGKLPHWVPSYGTTTSANGQVVQYAYVKSEPKPRKRIEKADGNFVLVMGGGVGPDAAVRGSRSATFLTQFAVKVDSYNFLGLSPGDPGYPDGSSAEFRNRQVPIKIIDFKLGSQDAVDWRVRRTFDRAAWARVFLMFRAPMLMVTDVTDSVQTKPRRLRYYDAVMYKLHDGTLRQCIVLKCAPAYVKDGVQMANYILVTTGNINEIAVMPPSHSPFMRLMKGMGRYMGNGQFDHPVYSSQKPSLNMASQIVGLPELSAEPLQYLDNTDPTTYGKFKFMLDYDHLG